MTRKPNGRYWSMALDRQLVTLAKTQRLGHGLKLGRNRPDIVDTNIGTNRRSDAAPAGRHPETSGQVRAQGDGAGSEEMSDNHGGA